MPTKGAVLARTEETTITRSFLCGLLGHGIAKSRSPAIHESEAAALGLRMVYRTVDFETFGGGGDALPDLLTAAEHFGFDGLNVTHPYKQVIMPLLDEISDEARGIGAVNTVVLRDGKRLGHNTDASGFTGCFRRGLPGAAIGHVLQIGAGGAGAATSHALLAMGAGAVGIHDIEPARAARLVESLTARFGAGRAYVAQDLDAAAAQADGLVQTSPVGMSGHPGRPISATLLRPAMWVLDIIYFPLETELMAAAQSQGCRTIGGCAMVVLQAADAFELFTGIPPDRDRMLRRFYASL